MKDRIKKIKAVFFDLDGTLVSFTTHRIPQSALESIRRVRECGVKVFVATGRPAPLVDNLGELECDGVLSASGACFTSPDGRMLQQKAVSKDDIRRMVEHQKAHRMPVMYATSCEAFTTFCNDVAVRMMDFHNIKHPVERDVDDALNYDIVAMIAYFPPEEQEFIMANVLKECDAYRWHPDFADCIAKGTSKATGIDDVIAMYGISLDETMAVGDGGNDIPMIRHAGIGVAMGNAADEVKECADIVADHIDSDGVAKLLDMIIN